MNKKVFILFFISKEDTVIRSVIAICHDPRKELLFFLFQKCQNALLSLLSYWLLKSFAFYSVFSLLFYDVCKRACLCDTCRYSHLHGDVRSPVKVLPEGLSFIQLRKSHQTRASVHPASTHNYTYLSPPHLGVLVCVHFGILSACLLERESLVCVVIFYK